jgi:hypothetical protein
MVTIESVPSGVFRDAISLRDSPRSNTVQLAAEVAAR